MCQARYVLGTEGTAKNNAQSSRRCRSRVASALVGPGCCPDRAWWARASRRPPGGGAPKRDHENVRSEARAGKQAGRKEHPVPRQ